VPALSGASAIAGRAGLAAALAAALLPSAGRAAAVDAWRHDAEAGTYAAGGAEGDALRVSCARPGRPPAIAARIAGEAPRDGGYIALLVQREALYALAAEGGAWRPGGAGERATFAEVLALLARADRVTVAFESGALTIFDTRGPADGFAGCAGDGPAP
jgi:hypothetical protein